MDWYKAAWQRMRPNPVPWIVLGLVFTANSGITGGLGLVLLPNLLRAFRDALANGDGPRISQLFRFRTDRLADDLLTMLLWLVVHAAAAKLALLVLVPVVLLFWVPALAAEGQLHGLSTVRASFAHTRANLLPVGAQAWGQFWYLDPLDPVGVGLSDAIEFTVGP